MTSVLGGRSPAVRWALALVALLPLGCSPAGAVRFGSEPAVGAPVWPPPPDTARIRYVGSISKPEDVGRSRSVFKRALELVVGRSDERVLQPYGLATDTAGRLYVADSALGAVHVFDLENRGYGLLADGLEFPVGVAVDGQGRLFVSDAEAGEVIGLDANGKEFLRITDGLERPAGLAFSAANGLLYVVDVLASEVVVFDDAGRLRFRFGGRGTGDGELNFPTNVAIDGDGQVYITDSMNFRVQVMGPDGSFLRRFGRLGDALGDFARPKGIGVDSEGHIYVVEGLYDAVNIFDGEGRYLLTFGSAGTGTAQFWLATGLCVDGRDRIYVADSYNGRIQVFQYLRYPS